MIIIRSPINFNIVEQVENGTSIEHLFDGFPPDEIIYTEPDDMEKLTQSALDDPYLERRVLELFEERMMRSEA